MSRFLWLIVGTLLALFPLMVVKAAVVEVEQEISAEVPEEEVRHVLFRTAVEKLVRAEMQKMNFDAATYDAALNTKFDKYFAEYEARKKPELEKAGVTGEALTKALAMEKPKALFGFAAWNKLLKRYTIRSFGPHAEKLSVWTMSLDGEVDERLLSMHVEKMQQTETKPFRKLFVLTQMRPDNFTWEDLKLSKPEEFVAPIEAEWLKWFQQNAPAEVEEVVLCDAACREQLDKWRAQDEKSMNSFVSPDLLGGLLLTVNITLSREVINQGVVPESKISYGGGVILQDLNTKRVLHYADLPAEVQTVRQPDQKQFNSVIASNCYRFPLGKFMEVKNQVGKSVSLTNSVVVRLVNPAHLGQALRLIEWIRVKGAPMQAQGKLDGFNKKEARILVFFRGEGNKFKSLVESAKELESEWGRPLTADISGSDVVLTLGQKQ